MNVGRIYQEMKVHSADSLTLVLTMYDMLLVDLHRAIEALRKGDIEERTQHIRHALNVIEQLMLSIDHKQGGDTARLLDSFYSIVRAKVLQAQFQQSRELLEDQAAQVESVREAWRQLSQRSAAQRAELAPPPPAGLDGSGVETGSWRG